MSCKNCGNGQFITDLFCSEYCREMFREWQSKVIQFFTEIGKNQMEELYDILLLTDDGRTISNILDVVEDMYGKRIHGNKALH